MIVLLYNCYKTECASSKQNLTISYRRTSKAKYGVRNVQTAIRKWKVNNTATKWMFSPRDTWCQRTNRKYVRRTNNVMIISFCLFLKSVPYSLIWILDFDIRNISIFYLKNFPKMNFSVLNIKIPIHWIESLFKII